MKGFRPELLLPSLLSVLVAAASCKRDDGTESDTLSKDEAYRLGKAGWTTVPSTSKKAMLAALPLPSPCACIDSAVRSWACRPDRRCG